MPLGWLGRLSYRILRELVDAEPAPVDAMVMDQAVLNIHDFDKLDLIAIGRLSRIFPD